MSLDYNIVYVLFIKMIKILLFINHITINFNNFNWINGFLILCYVIMELNERYDIDVKKDLIKIILEVLSLLSLYILC